MISSTGVRAADLHSIIVLRDGMGYILQSNLLVIIPICVGLIK